MILVSVIQKFCATMNEGSSFTKDQPFFRYFHSMHLSKEKWNGRKKSKTALQATKSS